MNDLEQAASCLVREADAAAPAAAPLPCLNRNNCTILPPSARKTAWLLEESVRRFIKRFGLENVGFLTLTFAEHIVDFKEAQKRWHSLKTHVLNKRYHGRWIRVIERQQSGRIHYHVLVAVGDNIRAGADFVAFARRDYRSANANLRREWAFWRTISQKYRFGRTEIMPIYKTDEAVAKYVGKYIAKHIERRLAIDNSSVPDVPALSKEAETLLQEASRDPSASIVRLAYLGGFLIQTNGKGFVEPNNPRSKAIWEAALNELEENDLVSDQGYKKEYFTLTKRGFEIAELLST